MRVGIVVPHIFMQDAVLPHVIFSPGTLALDLAEGLQALGVDATLYTPGPVTTPVRNVTADLSYFEKELAGRGDTYTTLMKKHPLTFVSLARQVQAELIAKAFADANKGNLDVVHIYTNEEDIALPFAQFCARPVVFTHHDPFSLLVRYKNNLPKYAHLNWISLSYAQRKGMPADTNWIANIYHGLPEDTYYLNTEPQGNYALFCGRIIEPKGTHLAIRAVRAYNQARPQGEPILQLKIAGKHYSGESKDRYWQEQIEPEVDDVQIHYVGFVQSIAEKQELFGNAKMLIMPSTFEEPFGMVAIEAMACGTPVVGLDSGAISEVVKEGVSGYIAPVHMTAGTRDDDATAQQLARLFSKTMALDRTNCRTEFTTRFTSARMCADHLATYQYIVSNG